MLGDGTVLSGFRIQSLARQSPKSHWYRPMEFGDGRTIDGFPMAAMNNDRPHTGWRRGALSAFVRRHEFAWDSAMGALTIAYVALAFGEDSELGFQYYAIWSLSVVFLAEFAAR